MTKLIELTKGHFSIVDDEDFEWASSRSWSSRERRKRGGSELRTVYASQGSRGSEMHVEIAKRMGIHVDGLQVDHIDGNGLNNQRSNLRMATNRQNQQNQRPRGGKSRFKGVTMWRANHSRPWVWRARIKDNYKYEYIATFPLTEEGEIEAAKAYDRRAIEKGWTHSLLNFPAVTP